MITLKLESCAIWKRLSEIAFTIKQDYLQAVLKQGFSTMQELAELAFYTRINSGGTERQLTGCDQ
jgi:hypothetical protein